MVTKLGTFWQHYLFRAVLSGPLLGAAALVERGLVARGRAHALVLAQTVVLEIRHVFDFYLFGLIWSEFSESL